RRRCRAAFLSWRFRSGFGSRRRSRPRAWWHSNPVCEYDSLNERVLFQESGRDMQISGSSALVVGGTGGLGEATTRRLAAAEAKVVVADVADEKGRELEKELGIRYVHTDATDEESVNAAIAEAKALGPLRISVDTHGGP